MTSAVLPGRDRGQDGHGHSIQHHGRVVTGAAHLGARLARIVAIGMLVTAVLAACTSGPERVTGGPSSTYLVPSGIHKIKHVIIVMQENRSFDSYIGTYPGPDGIPMRGDVPAVCVPDPAGRC